MKKVLSLNLPFVGTYVGSVDLHVQRIQNLSMINLPGDCDFSSFISNISHALLTNGVECRGDTPLDSPHLRVSLPHAEASSHVLGTAGLKVSALNKLFDTPIPVSTLTVTPKTFDINKDKKVPVYDARYGQTEKQISVVLVGDKDHYAIAEEKRQTIDMTQAQFITAHDIQPWLEDNPQDDTTQPRGLYLHFDGYEVMDHPTQSPSLTIEAAQLLSKAGYKVIMTNAPSWDQQSEGGLCIVHKILFHSGVQLLVETVSSLPAEDKPFNVSLKVEGDASPFDDAVSVSITQSI